MSLFDSQGPRSDPRVEETAANRPPLYVRWTIFFSYPKFDLGGVSLGSDKPHDVFAGQCRAGETLATWRRNQGLRSWPPSSITLPQRQDRFVTTMQISEPLTTRQVIFRLFSGFPMFLFLGSRRLVNLISPCSNIPQRVHLDYNDLFLGPMLSGSIPFPFDAMAPRPGTALGMKALAGKFDR